MALARIASKLGTLNTTFLDRKKSAFLGSTDSDANLINNTFTGTDQSVADINRAFNNTVAASGGNSGTGYSTLPTSTTVPTSTNIYIYNTTNKAYNTAVTIAGYTSSQLTVNNETNFTSDINCMCLLNTNGSTIPNVFFTLQALYAWYSLFDAVNWKLYKNNQSVTIQVPDFTSTSALTTLAFTSFTLQQANATNSGLSVKSTTTQLNSQQILSSNTGNIVSLMNYYIPDNLKIFDSTNFNPYVARRIIHLFIILIQYNIAVTYFNTTTPIATPSLIDDFYKLLQAFNYNVTDTESGVYTQILSALNTRSQQYTKNQQDITSLDNQVSDLKDNIATDSAKLNSRMSYQSKSKIYQTVAITMLIIIGAGASILYTVPLEYKQKLSGGGTLIIIAVLTSIILQYQSNSVRVKEGFDTTYKTLAGLTSATSGGSYSWSGSVSGYYNSMLDQCEIYLNNTFLLTASLDSYHIYGNVNYAAQRELQFFGDTKTSLSMKDRGLQDMYNISYMDQVRFTALMNLAISLSLIIAVTITFTLAVENFPSVKKAVFIIGGCLALISVTLYILEISSRVHTKPKQLYWSAGDVKQLQSSS